MNSSNANSPTNHLLPLLAALIVICLAAAAALTLLTRSAAPVAAPAEQLSLLVQRMPLEAQNALRGEASAFDALGKSVSRLKTLRSSLTGPAAGDAAAWTKLNDGVATVAQARPAVESILTANQEARELAPKLLSELGDLASSVGGQKLDIYVERFELMVQRIQQDLNGLGSGVSDAAPAAQRLADSLEFLNEVIRGLSGEESGLALSKISGKDPEQRLKTVAQRNQQYTNSVRNAIRAAEPLAKAQVAARALPAIAGTLVGEIGEAPIHADAGANYKALIVGLLAAAAVLLAGLS